MRVHTSWCGSRAAQMVDQAVPSVQCVVVDEWGNHATGVAEDVQVVRGQYHSQSVLFEPWIAAYISMSPVRASSWKLDNLAGSLLPLHYSGLGRYTCGRKGRHRPLKEVVL